MDEEHVAPRREFCHVAPERANALHAYGVDFLSTKDVMEAFQGFDTKEVEWLDDSSCNIVFDEASLARDVIKALASPDSALQDEHWTLSRPMKVGGAFAEQKQSAKAKARARKTKAKEVQLQLRIATEADRKDPGHSGHTDSVYYTHVKEQQALERQYAELRREKKRARVSRRHAGKAPEEAVAGAADGTPSASSAALAPAEMPAAAELPSDAAAAPALPAPGAPASMEGVVPAIGGADVVAGMPKMGFRSLLDPLLFLRAPGLGGGGAASTPAAAPSGTAGVGDAAGGAPRDLREMLRRAEAEYAAVQTAVNPATSSTARAASPGVATTAGAAAAPGGKARGRDCSRGPGGGRSRGREATPPFHRGGRPRDRTPGTPGGRQRDRTPGTPGGRAQEKTAQQGHQRGKKRRPLEQEPRAVSEAAAPAKRPESLPAVEAFLKEHRVRCQRYTLNRTFRGILFGQQQKKKRQQQAVKGTKKPANAAAGVPAEGGAPESSGAADAEGDAKMAVADEPMAESSLSEKADQASQAPANAAVGDEPAGGKADAAMRSECNNDADAGGDAKMAVADKSKAESALPENDKNKQQKAPRFAKPELPPWDQYMRANNHFTKHGHFMHTIGWQAGDQKFYTVVPHPTRVDLDRLARAAQVPRERIRQRKLKEVSEDTGFPVFICPPVGIRADAAGKKPMLLVDSAVTEYKKPLLFDCGCIGLSIPCSEFLRSTGAACIEGLGVQPPEAKGGGVAATESPTAASARAVSPAKSAPEPAPEPAPAPAEVPGPGGPQDDVVPMST